MMMRAAASGDLPQALLEVPHRPQLLSSPTACSQPFSQGLLLVVTSVPTMLERFTRYAVFAEIAARLGLHRDQPLPETDKGTLERAAVQSRHLARSCIASNAARGITTDSKFVLYHLWLAVPWSTSDLPPQAPATMPLSHHIGAVLDKTLAPPYRLRALANSWVKYASSLCRTLCKAWSDAVDAAYERQRHQRASIPAPPDLEDRIVQEEAAEGSPDDPFPAYDDIPDDFGFESEDSQDFHMPI
jgi:hypothetical protein